MAITIELTIPTGIAGDVVDAFSWRNDYERHKELLSGDPGDPESPLVWETDVVFAKRMVRNLITSTYTSYMHHQASTEAGAAAEVAAQTAAATITVQ